MRGGREPRRPGGAVVAWPWLAGSVAAAPGRTATAGVQASIGRASAQAGLCTYIAVHVLGHFFTLVRSSHALVPSMHVMPLQSWARTRIHSGRGARDCAAHRPTSSGLPSSSSSFSFLPRPPGGGLITAQGRSADRPVLASSDSLPCRCQQGRKKKTRRVGLVVVSSPVTCLVIFFLLTWSQPKPCRSLSTSSHLSCQPASARPRTAASTPPPLDPSIFGPGWLFSSRTDTAEPFFFSLGTTRERPNNANHLPAFPLSPWLGTKLRDAVSAAAKESPALP